jgi:hypothetical protein
MRSFAAIVAFLLATGLETAGSLACLIPTQGMHGNERFVLVFLSFSTAFVAVNAIGAGIGLFPLWIVCGVLEWRRAVLGFMAGSVLSALCISAELELIPEAHANELGPFRLGMLLIGIVSPPVGGLVAILMHRRA